MFKEKGHRASHCPTKEQKGNNKSNKAGKQRFNGSATTVEKQDIRK